VRGSPRSTQLRPPPPTFPSSLVTTSFVRHSKSHSSLTTFLTSSFSLTAETWEEYGTQWKVHYNTHIAGKPIPTSGPTLPPLPTTDATGEDWATWGSAVSEAWNEYAKEKGVDLPKVLEGLKKPELINGDWASYSAEWDEYGKQVGEKFQAALAAKST
jgi:hypothetical protein